MAACGALASDVRPEASAPAPTPNHDVDDAESEITRWVVALGAPFVVAAVAVAAAIGTSIEWLFGAAIFFGPGAAVTAIIYLAMTSDTNGARSRRRASTRESTQRRSTPVATPVMR